MQEPWCWSSCFLSTENISFTVTAESTTAAAAGMPLTHAGGCFFLRRWYPWTKALCISVEITSCFTFASYPFCFQPQVRQLSGNCYPYNTTLSSKCCFSHTFSLTSFSSQEASVKLQPHKTLWEKVSRQLTSVSVFLLLFCLCMQAESHQGLVSVSVPAQVLCPDLLSLLA